MILLFSFHFVAIIGQWIFNCLISRCENERKNNWLQWQCVDVKQFFTAVFVVYFFKDKGKKNASVCHRGKWWTPTFTLTCLADECTPLRLRYKTMTAWNMRLVYIYILYPFENNIFCHGRQLFSQRQSLFVRKHTHTHTYKHYTCELMASGSTWTKLSLHIYSMVIFFFLNLLRYSLLAWSWRLISFVWKMYCS